MKSRNEIVSSIVKASALKDKTYIKSVLDEHSEKLSKMDRWFDMFLDRFDSKMDSLPYGDPILKLYDTKFKEYEDVSQIVKVAKAYLIK